MWQEETRQRSGGASDLGWGAGNLHRVQVGQQEVVSDAHVVIRTVVWAVLG